MFSLRLNEFPLEKKKKLSGLNMTLTSVLLTYRQSSSRFLALVAAERGTAWEGKKPRRVRENYTCNHAEKGQEKVKLNFEIYSFI